MQPISILYQSQDILVVDKPSGISVHNIEDSANLLTLLCSQLSLAEIFPVHRLDKETSGVQIFALHKNAARSLSDIFQARETVKKYRGIVRGQISSGQGQWDKPLTDKAEGRKAPQGVLQNRVPCRTDYQVIDQTDFLSLCEFRIFTGRQHQIRKHTALAGHPLVGDGRYGSMPLNKKIQSLYKTPRLFLHCQEISFNDEIYRTEVPQEFELLMKK